MRNPGRRDGDDARPDQIDPSTPQAGSAEGPADDGTAGVPASQGPADASDSTDDDLGELFDDPADIGDPADVADLAGSADYDDLLFDPLLSDEPIDLAAVRADDALIDALGGGDLTGADDLVDPDDPLIAMLAAWAASARPEAEIASPIADETACVDQEATDAPLLRPVAEAPVGETAGTASAGSPDSLPAGGSTDVGAGTTDPGETGAGDTDSHDTSDFPDLDLPTVRLLPAAGLRPSAGPRPRADSGDPAGPVRLVAGAAAAAPAAAGRPLTAASVAGLLSRTRRLRRRARPAGQSLPPGHPCAAPRSPSSSSRWGSAGPPPAGAPRCRAIPPGRSPRCSSRSGRGRSRRHRSCPRGWSGPSSR